MDDLRDYINKLRHDFSMMQLDESAVKKNPVQQFEHWFREAVEAKVHDPNAMIISTVGKNLRPSARVVLLRGFNEEGFVFYTNYNSRKGMEIGENNFACFTFYWPEVERQIRIEGKLQKQSAEASDKYFLARPRGSRLGAWASPQSEVITGRKFLDEKLEGVEKKFEGKDVPRPEWWGGFVLVPDRFEFWQGRPNRLHDRICYVKEKDAWKIERLAP